MKKNLLQNRRGSPGQQGLTGIQGSPGTTKGNPVGTSFLKIWSFVSKHSKDKKAKFIADKMLEKYGDNPKR